MRPWQPRPWFLAVILFLAVYHYYLEKSAVFAAQINPQIRPPLKCLTTWLLPNYHLTMKWMLWLFLPILALAFTKEDLEIFSLRDNIIADLGEDVTFYSWLGVDTDADGPTITKAYRKLSRAIHPDKNPSDAATQRFARLGLVHKILRSDGRSRYDFYLRKGFPAHKDGNYLFNRYRPGVVFALAFILVVTTGIHYVLRVIDTRRKREFLQGVIDEATDKARSSSGIVETEKRVTLDGGRTFTVLPTGEVYFNHKGSESLVDVNALATPTIRDTFPFLLWNKLTGSSKTEELEEEEAPSKESSPESHTLKKGAARRRAVGARGKAKIF